MPSSWTAGPDNMFQSSLAPLSLSLLPAPHTTFFSVPGKMLTEGLLRGPFLCLENTFLSGHFGPISCGHSGRITWTESIIGMAGKRQNKLLFSLQRRILELQRSIRNMTESGFLLWSISMTVRFFMIEIVSPHYTSAPWSHWAMPFQQGWEHRLIGWIPGLTSVRLCVLGNDFALFLFLFLFHLWAWFLICEVKKNSSTIPTTEPNRSFHAYIPTAHHSLAAFIIA